MKLAVKIYGLITILIRAIVMLVLIIYMSKTAGKDSCAFTSKQAILIILCIAITTAVCSAVLTKVKETNHKNQLIAPGVLTIIIGDIALGILILCLKEKDVAPRTIVTSGANKDDYIHHQ